MKLVISKGGGNRSGFTWNPRLSHNTQRSDHQITHERGELIPRSYRFQANENASLLKQMR